MDTAPPGGGLIEKEGAINFLFWKSIQGQADTLLQILSL